MRRLCLLALVYCVSAAGAAGEYYVAPDGDDGNPGTQAQPFATLTRARNALRRRKKAKPDTDYRVLLRGGTYRIDETVVFSLKDSAADNHTITWAAFPGERPVLTPAVPLRKWKKVDTPPAGLPAEARGRVWSAQLPEGLGRFYTLYKGTKRLPRARGKGFKPTNKARSWRAADQTVMHFPKGAIRNSRRLNDCEVILVTAAPWTMNILPLASVDEEKCIARTAIPGTYALTQPRFGHFPVSAWVENTFTALDRPGEWVLDTGTRTVYLIPEGDEPGDDIAVPALTELVRVEGGIDYDGPKDTPVRGLVFRGLTFTQADRYTWEKGRTGWGIQHDWEMFDRPSAMVRLRGAENCAVRHCRFTNAGCAAVRLDLHCRNNRIEGNVIARVGGVGILLCGYGPGTKDVNRRNTVTRNHIHRVGEIYRHAPGIFVWQSGENLIGNNLVHNTPYSAIVVSGRIGWDRRGKAECSRTVRWKEVDAVLGTENKKRDWRTREPFLHGRSNRIVRNDIHHAVEVMTDGNGIYISGTGGGNLVRENVVHDCPSRNFAEGIRCDDDQHETIIERNIVWRLGGLATCVTLKGMNHVRNNIFAAPLSPPRRGMLSLELPRNTSLAGAEIKRNIFYATRKNDRICFQGKNYYGNASWLRDAAADRNVYHNTADPQWGKRHLDAERKHGSEMHSISADPLFADPAEGNFDLKPGSPALKLGFEPIDMSRIGLQ